MPLDQVRQFSRSTPLVGPAAYFLLISAASQAVRFLLLPVYLAYLAPEEYGLLTLVTLIAGGVGLLASLKLDSAMRTFYFDFSEDPERRFAYLRQVFSLAAVNSVWLTALLLLAGDRLFGLLFSQNDVPFLPAGMLATVAACANACLSIYLVYLRNGFELRRLLRWEASLLIGTVTLQILLITRFDAGIYGVLVGALVPSIVGFLIAGFGGPFLFTPRISRLVLPSLRYALPLLVLGLVYELGTKLDRLVLERVVSLSEIGAYALLLTLMGLAKIALGVADSTVRPFLFNDLRRHKQDAYAQLDGYQRIHLSLGLAALSTAVLFGTLASSFTDSPAYLQIQSWLALASTAFLPLIITQFHALLFQFSKNSTALSVGAVLRTGLLFALLYALAPRFGIVGALNAILLSELLASVIYWYVLRRSMRIPAPSAATIFQLIAFVAIEWVLSMSVAPRSIVLFGIVQSLSVGGLLALMNYRRLRELASHLRTFNPHSAADAPGR